MKRSRTARRDRRAPAARGVPAARCTPTARLISPALPPRCKYYPTCSTYAVQAVRELGVIRGTVLAAWRLVRCNPWSHGGVDELADRRLFRDRTARARITA